MSLPAISAIKTSLPPLKVGLANEITIGSSRGESSRRNQTFQSNQSERTEDDDTIGLSFIKCLTKSEIFIEQLKDKFNMAQNADLFTQEQTE